MRPSSPQESASAARELGHACVRISARFRDMDADPVFRARPDFVAKRAEQTAAFNRFEAEAVAWVEGGCRGEVPVVPECLTGPMFEPRHGV